MTNERSDEAWMLVVDLPTDEFYPGDRVVVPLPPIQGEWYAPAGWTKHERSISRIWTPQSASRLVISVLGGTVDPR